MMKSILSLIQIFLLMALALNSIVIIAFLFFEGLSYFSEGSFRLNLLWRGLKGGLYGAFGASIIIWFFYNVIPMIKNKFYR